MPTALCSCAVPTFGVDVFEVAEQTLKLAIRRERPGQRQLSDASDDQQQ
jgi:hypothetical protein